MRNNEQLLSVVELSIAVIQEQSKRLNALEIEVNAYRSLLKAVNGEGIDPGASQELIGEDFVVRQLKIVRSLVEKEVNQSKEEVKTSVSPDEMYDSPQKPLDAAALNGN